MSKPILITHIAGFIGSSLTKKVLELGYNVVGVDNLYAWNLNNAPAKANIVKNDLSREDDYYLIPDITYDWVLHIAG
jgi:nucleoside-diphosphate-sugar epimerase